MRETAEIRTRVLDFLAVTAGTASVDAGDDALMARVGYILCKRWLELYAPGLRYIDGLKGDRDTVASDVFRSAFTDEENAYLERFSRFVELRVEMTPEDLLVRRELNLDRWAGIARDARNTLELIDPGREIGRPRIGDILRLAEGGGR